MGAALEIGLADIKRRRVPSTATWMGVWAGLAALLALGALAAEGLGPGGVDLGLRLTARLAFLPFWLCYAGGALAVLFGARFMPLNMALTRFSRCRQLVTTTPPRWPMTRVAMPQASQACRSDSHS